MARFTASWTNTETADFEAGDFLRYDKLRDQIGQNIEFLGQSHDHNGDSGDGGTLAVANPLFIWFLAAPLGSPFP